MARISVAEAAERLGVVPQRIHQRIADGSLPAERVGGRWVINERDLARVASSRSPGRPLSSRSAWALVAAAANSSGALSALSAPDRSRAKSRYMDLLAASLSEDERVLVVMLGALRNLANRHCYRAAEADLPDLRADPRLRLSGLSHPDSGLAAGDVVEGYLSAGDIDDVVRDYLLRPVDRDRANVVLHVADPAAPRVDWKRALDDEASQRLVLAADLAQHDGPRERHRAVEVLRDLLATQPDLAQSGPVQPKPARGSKR